VRGRRRLLVPARHGRLREEKRESRDGGIARPLGAWNSATVPGLYNPRRRSAHDHIMSADTKSPAAAI
jgi:hypothetical protein